ncbi:MAG: EamA family transporter [Clostridia bacterium]|nr:EamA family transporter [Clostridia bacterium]
MSKENLNYSKLQLIGSMLIFGTVGIFVKYIPLPSDIIAFVRGIIGALILFVIAFVSGKKINFSLLKQKGITVILSGAFIGINWILLFEAYRYTTVATATLCYYLAPVFVILFSPVFLGEKLSVKKIICCVIALIGMIFVSGVAEKGIPPISELKGVIFGISAAIFYATVIILNKKITHIPSFDRTFFQLFSAGVVLIPYSLLTKSFKEFSFEPKTLFLLILVGIIHTGIAYVLYFGSMKGLSGQTVAIFSYIDPVSAIILSSLILPDEKITLYGIIGGILILGATLACEINVKNKKTHSS